MRIALRRFSIEHLWPLVVLVGVFAFVNTHPIRPQDFWWHIAVGREIVQSGHIPAVDTFSYTAAGQPYPSYQMFWLAEVALYGLYTLGGAAWTILAHSLVITTAYALILWLCWHASGSWRLAALGTLFAAALGFNDWNVRPQALTFLLGALFLWGIERGRSREGRFLPFLFFGCMVIWANCHGTFGLGLALLAAWLLDELWRWAAPWLLSKTPRAPFPRLPALSLGLALLACLLNPRGIGIVAYLNTMAGSSVVQTMVPEWAPPTFGDLGGGLFLGGLLLLAAVLALSPRRPPLFQLLVFLGLAALSLKTSRGIVWFGLALAPTLAEHLAALAGQLPGRRRASPARGSPWLNGLIAGLLLLMALFSLPWFKDALPLMPQKRGLLSGETPVDATRFLLEARPPGHLFHTLSFGSYLDWAASTQYPVFVDSRLELYPPDVWQDYIAISNSLPDWEARLARYDVQTLMLSPAEHGPLIVTARAAGWQETYADAAAVILTRPQRP